MKKQDIKKALLVNGREKVFRRIVDNKFMGDVLGVPKSQFKKLYDDMKAQMPDDDIIKLTDIIVNKFEDIVPYIDDSNAGHCQRMRKFLTRVIIVDAGKEDEDMVEIGMEDYIAIVVLLRNLNEIVFAPKGKNFSGGEENKTGESSDSDDEKSDESDDGNSSEGDEQKNKKPDDEDGKNDGQSAEDEPKFKGILGKWLKEAEKYTAIVPGSDEEKQSDKAQQSCLNEICDTIFTYNRPSAFDNVAKKEIWNFAAWAAEQVFCATTAVKKFASNDGGDMKQLTLLYKLMQKKGSGTSDKKKFGKMNYEQFEESCKPGEQLIDIIKDGRKQTETVFINTVNTYVKTLPKTVASSNRIDGKFYSWFGKWLFGRIQKKDKFIEQIVDERNDKLEQVIALINYSDDRRQPKYSDKEYSEYLDMVKSFGSDPMMQTMFHADLLARISA